MPSPDSRWQSLPDRAHSIAWLVAGFTVLRLLLAATAPLERLWAHTGLEVLTLADVLPRESAQRPPEMLLKR